MDDYMEYEKKCPYCGETYISEAHEQTPGFRMDEDDVCPYCDKVIRSSLEYEYYNRKK